jgi:uncharacterized protein (TIGR00251 family)
LESEAKISLRVYPNAARNEVLGFAGDVLRIKIAAPPVRGKANKELLSFLSRLLGVSQTALAISRGHTSRNKMVTVRGLGQDELLARLSPEA